MFIFGDSLLARISIDNCHVEYYHGLSLQTVNREPEIWLNVPEEDTETVVIVLGTNDQELAFDELMKEYQLLSEYLCENFPGIKMFHFILPKHITDRNEVDSLTYQMYIHHQLHDKCPHRVSKDREFELHSVFDGEEYKDSFESDQVHLNEKGISLFKQYLTQI